MRHLRSLLHAWVGPPLRGFRRFWLATSISVLGTWIAAVALAIRMFDVTGSPGWVSALLFAEFTPLVLIGFLFGHRLDRLPVRGALAVSDLVSAAVFAALAFVDEPLAVVALAGVAGIAGGVARPLSTAAVPLLVPDHELERATGAIGSADNAMTFLGEVIGGVLVGTVGASVALGLNAVSFAVSAALIAGTAALARPAHLEMPDSTSLRPRETIRRIRRSPILRQIALGWAAGTVVLGVVLAVQVPLLRGEFGASPAAVGLILGLDAAGLVAGSMFAGSRTFGRAAFPLSLAGMGACVMIAGASSWLGLAAFGLTALGVFNGVAIILNRTRALRATEPAERASTIAFLIALAATGQVTGTILGGALATALSPRWAFVLAGTFALLVAAPVSLVVGPRAEWQLRPSPWAERGRRSG
ncbi:MAG TPA: MFS transporter [Gaiellales bacterium]|nr:MFS transporter [Gaiellales bacterium]